AFDVDVLVCEGVGAEFTMPGRPLRTVLHVSSFGTPKVSA
ncbi:MAG: hypothetical protein ACI835_005292, partial [Planctomycetota bacterium]